MNDEQRKTKLRCPVCGHRCNPDNMGGWVCDKRGGCGYEEPNREQEAEAIGD